MHCVVITVIQRLCDIIVALALLGNNFAAACKACFGPDLKEERVASHADT